MSSGAVVNRLLVCLGNMDAKYLVTRHNIGHMFADYFVGRYLPQLVPENELPIAALAQDDSFGGGFASVRLHFQPRLPDGRGVPALDLVDSISLRRQERTRVEGIPFPDVWLHVLKPNSFMNNCGPQVEKSVRKLGLRLKRNPLSTNFMDEVIVVHDDTGILFGDCKMSHQIGDGNHNGVKSVLRHLPPNQKIARLRIGVGKPGLKPRDYVLGRFSGVEQDVLAREFPFLCEVLRVYLFRGTQEAELICNSAKPFC